MTEPQTPTFKASLFERPGEVTADDLAELADLALSVSGADWQHDNNVRATRGARALRAHILAHADQHRGEDEMETEVADMLADLRHLCDALGVDYEGADYSARINHEFEVHGQRR